MSSFERNIVWSDKTFHLSDFEDQVVPFPVIVKTNGEYTETNWTIGKDHMMVLHGWEWQERIIARNVRNVAISIPVDHDHKLKVTLRKTQSKVEYSSPLPPSSVVKLYTTPMEAFFDVARESQIHVNNRIYSSKKFGPMIIEKTYQVKFLLTSHIDQDGAIDTAKLDALKTEFLSVGVRQAVSVRSVDMMNLHQLLKYYKSSTSHLTGERIYQACPGLAEITEYTERRRNKPPAVAPKPGGSRMAIAAQAGNENLYTTDAVLPPFPPYDKSIKRPAIGDMYLDPYSSDEDEDDIDKDYEIVDYIQETPLPPPELPPRYRERPAKAEARPRTKSTYLEQIKKRLEAKTIQEDEVDAVLNRLTYTTLQEPSAWDSEQQNYIPNIANNPSPIASNTTSQQYYPLESAAEIRPKPQTRNTLSDEINRNIAARAARRYEADVIDRTTNSGLPERKDEYEKYPTSMTTNAIGLSRSEHRLERSLETKSKPQTRNTLLDEIKKKLEARTILEDEVDDKNKTTPNPTLTQPSRRDGGQPTNMPHFVNNPTPATLKKISQSQKPLNRDHFGSGPNGESGQVHSESPQIQTGHSSSVSELLIQDWGDVPADLSELSLEQVASCLRLLKLERHIEMFKDFQIDGNLLITHSEDDFKDWGMDSREAKKLFMFASRGWRLKSQS